MPEPQDRVSGQARRSDRARIDGSVIVLTARREAHLPLPRLQGLAHDLAGKAVVVKQRFEHTRCETWAGRPATTSRDPITVSLHRQDIGVLNLQSEGWELVAVTTSPRGIPTFYLKRPIENAEDQ